MTYTIHLGLVAFSCEKCGMTFGVPENYYNIWRLQGEKWDRRIHCVGCGHRWYCGEGTEQRLRRQLEAERAAHDQTKADRDHHVASANAYKGHLGRVKKRVANGVCPCCMRTFQNLARHMTTKHPDYLKEAKP
jgi:hypothetical protein